MLRSTLTPQVLDHTLRCRRIGGEDHVDDGDDDEEDDDMGDDDASIMMMMPSSD